MLTARRAQWGLFFVMSLPLFGQNPAGNPGSQDYIVSFRPGTSANDRAAAPGRAGASVRFAYRHVNAMALRIPNANAYAALQRNPQVTAIVPNRPVSEGPTVVEPDAKPGTGGGGGPTGEVVPQGVKRVGEPTATSNGNGIKVAVLDTGIDAGHSDLAGAVHANRFDAFSAGGTCNDVRGHGTHVAGIIGARKGNSTGVVGVAPNVVLYCGKVLDDTGSGSDASVMAGLEWALDQGVNVVNMSLGRPGSLGDNPALRTLVQLLHSRGIVIVVSAGNDPNKEASQQVPATYPEVFAVASTTAVTGTENCSFLTTPIPADTASWFTTDGAYDTATGIGVTISAPGADQENVGRNCVITSVGILSLKAGGGTTRMSGTSMAAPHVSGVVARMIQNGGTAPENIRTAIRTGANRKGVAPLTSPTSSYTFDGEKEGIVKAP